VCLVVSAATVTVSASLASSIEDHHEHQGVGVLHLLDLHSYVSTASPFRVVLAPKQFGLAPLAVASAQRQIVTIVPPDLGGLVVNVAVASMGEGSR